jgi:hypothetical protein
MMTVEIRIVGNDYDDFIERVRRCASFLHERDPLSKFCALNGFKDFESAGFFSLWGEGQVWKIQEVDRYVAIAYVDDEIAATVVALLS